MVVRNNLKKIFIIILATSFHFMISIKNFISRQKIIKIPFFRVNKLTKTCKLGNIGINELL